MLPTNVFEKLKANLNWCFDGVFSIDENKFIVTSDDKKYFEEEVGVKSRDSAFVDFYTAMAIPVVGKGEELLTLERIIELNEVQNDEAKRYLQISSIEGEGSYFFDKESDAVFDVSWGDEEDLKCGKLTPLYDSFYDFLEWYYS